MSIALGSSEDGPDPHHDGELYRRYQAGPARNDQELCDTIREQLIRDERVDASQIGVTVEGGVVTLHGEVATVFEKRAAGQDALGAGGVAGVSNLLRVRESLPAGR